MTPKSSEAKWKIFTQKLMLLFTDDLVDKQLELWESYESDLWTNASAQFCEPDQWIN